MVLADMIRTDEGALICDLAETYHIFNYRELPPLLVATLSVGLRDNSRIKMKISGMNQPLDTMLLAACLDKLAFILWSKTEDAQRGRNKPQSVFEALSDSEEKKTKQVETFESGEDFMKRWAELVEDINHG